MKEDRDAWLDSCLFLARVDRDNVCFSIPESAVDQTLTVFYAEINERDQSEPPLSSAFVGRQNIEILLHIEYNMTMYTKDAV